MVLLLNDFNIKFRSGNTFLHVAIQQNCLKELISAFGNGVKITEEMLMVHDTNGDTLLNYAIQQSTCRLSENISAQYYINSNTNGKGC